VPRGHQARVRSSFWRNAGVNYGERGVLILSTLLVTPYLFRRLSLGAFGTWSVMFTLMTVFSLVELGIAAGVVKYVAEHHARGKRREVSDMLGSAVAIMSLVGVLSFAACAAIGVLGSGLAAVGEHDAFRTGMLVLGVGLAIRLPGAAYGAVLVGYERYDLFSATIAFTTVVWSIGAVAAVRSGSGVLGLAAAYAVALVAGGLLQVVLLRRVDPSLRGRPRRRAGGEHRRLLTFSSFALLADSMTFIGQRMDTLVVAAVRSARAAAPIGAASNLQSGMQALTLPFVNLLMPMSSRLSARGHPAELMHRHRLATRAVLQISLPIAFILALFPHDIVRLWLGPRAPAVTAAVIAVLAIQTLFMAAAPAEKILVGIGRVRLVGVLNTVEGLGNLAVSIALVAAYGTIGAAVGSLIASTLVGPWKWPLAARATGDRVRPFLRAGIGIPVVSSLPAIAAMVAVRALLPSGTPQLLLGAAVGVGLALAVAIAQVGPGELRTGWRALLSSPPPSPVAPDRS
jgi:O-antigen/teichoic acid export membrane protein